MDKKSNKQLIAEMKETLDNTFATKRKKLTLESVVFGGEDGNPYEMDNPGFDDGQPDFYEEGEQVNPSMKPLIDQIRSTCLQCLQKLANTPEAPEYDLFKKIWGLCDKAVDASGKNNASKTE